MRHPSPYLVVAAVAGWIGCKFDPSGVPSDQNPSDAPIATDGSTGGPTIDGSADAPIDSAPPIDSPADTNNDSGTGDSDGDGKPDAQDNCPGISNADQRDHDLDGRGDACDGCPHIPDKGTDDDGDEIDDACDPHRGDDKDVLVHFDGFYDDADKLPVDWKAGTGAAANWQIRNGQLRNTVSAGLRLASWTHTKSTDQVVDTRVTVLAISTPVETELNVGIVAGHDDGIGQGALWSCSLFDLTNDADNAVVRLIDHDTTGNSRTVTSSSPLSFPIEVGRPSSFRIELRGLSSPSRVAQACRLDFDSEAPTFVNAEEAGTVEGFPGLRVRGVSAAFDYIVVYGRRP